MNVTWEQLELVQKHNFRLNIDWQLLMF